MIEPLNKTGGRNEKAGQTGLWGRALYDWVNSAFATALMAG